MGRGRAKAKQTRIARQLKYDGSATDLDRVRRDLGVTDQDGPEEVFEAAEEYER